MKKKIVATLLASAMVLSLAACGKTEEVAETATEAVEETAETVEEATEEVAETVEEAVEEEVEETENAGGVFTYADYVDAELDTEVTVETYVQAKQGWWENEGVGMATFYTQDKDGAYFLYNMPCSEEDYELMVPGTKIIVTGYKSEWSGEVEITDATYSISEDGETYVATAADVTDKLGTDEIADYMNQFVAFKGMTVEGSGDDNAAFLYNWDGSGSQGDDLYFNVSKDGKTYTFCVESYLCGSDTDVYKAVEGLNVGDTIDVEGFMYWYEGPQPHVTNVTVK
ncbi:hypothetical protein SAMN02910292_00728 [Lachnospiraceae bacterium XBB2008]|nr:hypothetical protein SAMN02910292_00728 [Lachnospiraceae bacterium XBB2008]